jgi:hypothetical protein
LGFSASGAPQIQLITPQNFEVVQRDRSQGNYGPISFRGTIGNAAADCIEVRLMPTGGTNVTQWYRISTAPVAANTTFGLSLSTAEGSYTVEVRAVSGQRAGASISRQNVGVGEVFITAGQSNSTFAGDTPTQTATGFVSFFDGTEWSRCADNLPRIDPYGSAGNLGTAATGRQGGSPWCLLGDLLFAAWHVPIALAPVGLSGTNVPKWAPAGHALSQFPPNWPSYAGSLALDAGPENVNVAAAKIAGTNGFVNADLAIPGAPDGGWVVENDGASCPGSFTSNGLPYNSCMRAGFLFARLTARLKYFGARGGLRAVLWHQGEGDACYQNTWAFQVPPNYYSDLLSEVIRQSRMESVVQAPWLIAHVGTTVPQAVDGGTCPSAADLTQIYAQQNRVIALSPRAFVGPNTDTLGAIFRSSVVPPHFNQAGLAAHAALWRDSVLAAFP